MNPLADHAEFASFYRRHSEDLLVFFTRRLFDTQEALDLTAETFAQAFLGRRRFRGETEAEALLWLYGIAKNILRRYFRRGKAERRALERLGLEVPALAAGERDRIEELADLEASRSAIAASLASLSKDQRDALVLRVIDERSYSDISGQLGVSEQTARARVSRGLRALAGALERERSAGQSI